VTLRAGRYVIRPDRPLVITAADSFLTLRSFAGEVAELTGAVPLDGLEWSRAPPASPSPGPAVTIWTTTVPLDSIAALRVNGRRAPKARYPNVVDVEAAGALGPLEGFISQAATGAAGTFGWIAANMSGEFTDHLSTAADWPGVEWIASKTRPTGTP